MLLDASLQPGHHSIYTLVLGQLFQKKLCSIKPCFHALSDLCEYLLELLASSWLIWFSFYPYTFLFNLYSFKGLFNMYLIYLIFIKYVANNKDLSQPLSYSKRGNNKWNQALPKQPYYLKSSVHVNIPHILKVD